jgi:hypothetical protein
MIIARIRGGLGNQLFQYAAAQALAWHKGVALKLDLYTYSKSKARKFELDELNIDATIASRQEVHQFTGSNPIVRYLNKRENYLRCLNVLAQPHYHFFEDFFSVNMPAYLSGYWNSEKYFKQYRTEILNQFTLRTQLPESSLNWKNQIVDCNSVAIHVRRGDYVANPVYQSFFGALPLQYYHEAMNEMKRRVTNPHFFIFSDDISWCQQNFAFLSDAKFITHKIPVKGSEDLMLMSNCRHQIIANSTFSWWGAWLNTNVNKVVIAPKRWFSKTFTDSPHPPYASRYYNTKDLLPESWIAL